MDLKDVQQFDWRYAASLRDQALIQYMNRFFFVVEREVQPIAMKSWNQVRRCNEILLLSYDRFNLLMTNKRISHNGKLMNVAHYWINHQNRMQYSQIIYWPGPTEKSVFNLCTGYQWPIEKCQQLYESNPELISEYLMYAQKFMTMDTMIAFLSYLSSIVKHPEKRAADFIIVLNGGTREAADCLIWPIFRMFGRNSVASSDNNGLFYYYEHVHYADRKRPPFAKYFSGEIKPAKQFVLEIRSSLQYHMSENAICAMLYYLLHYPVSTMLPKNSMLYDMLILNAEVSVVKWWRQVLNRGYHCRIEDLIDGNDLTCNRFIQTQGRKELLEGQGLDSWILEISQKDLYHCYKKDLTAQNENPVFSVQFWERMNEICQIISQRLSKNKYVVIKHRITPKRGKLVGQWRNGKLATAVLKYIILPPLNDCIEQFNRKTEHPLPASGIFSFE